MGGRRTRLTGGTLVLDSQGLSLVIDDDPAAIAHLKVARRRGAEVVISALTILEAARPDVKAARLEWVLSALAKVAPSMEIIKHALELLSACRLRCHAHAIDAVVAATALRQPAPVTMLTCDPVDMRRLCGDAVLIIPV